MRFWNFSEFLTIYQQSGTWSSFCLEMASKRRMLLISEKAKKNYIWICCIPIDKCITNSTVVVWNFHLFLFPGWLGNDSDLNPIENLCSQRIAMQRWKRATSIKKANTLQSCAVVKIIRPKDWKTKRQKDDVNYLKMT